MINLRAGKGRLGTGDRGGTGWENRTTACVHSMLLWEEGLCSLPAVYFPTLCLAPTFFISFPAFYYTYGRRREEGRGGEEEACLLTNMYAAL